MYLQSLLGVTDVFGDPLAQTRADMQAAAMPHIPINSSMALASP